MFGARQHGESKLDSLVVLDYLTLLLDKLVGRWVPVRFLMFTAVGSLGVLLHMAVLAATLRPRRCVPCRPDRRHRHRHRRQLLPEQRADLPGQAAQGPRPRRCSGS